MTWEILTGDVRQMLTTLTAESVDTCITSPPYWGLRDYGHEGQLGLESTPEAYVQAMVEVFREVRRVLKPTGTLWLNLGDSYARAPEKGGSGTPNGRNLPKMGYTGAKEIPATRTKTLLASPGAWPSPSRRTAGISARTSFGTSLTRCRRA